MKKSLSIMLMVFTLSITFCNAQYTTKCIFCKKIIPLSSKYCSYCGKEQNSKRYCIKCKKEILKNASFCSFCGIKQIDNENNIKEIEKSDNCYVDSRDGKTYKIVKIGKQTWLAENLNYKINKGSWCYNNMASNCENYGRLYDWEAAKIACPKGWHLPSYDDWTTLINKLGGKMVAGGKLKTTNFWDSPNKGADNSSGFNGKPGKYKWQDFNCGIGQWWSTEEYDSVFAYSWYLSSSFPIIFRTYDGGKDNGLNVRCVKN